MLKAIAFHSYDPNPMSTYTQPNIAYFAHQGSNGTLGSPLELVTRLRWDVGMIGVAHDEAIKVDEPLIVRARNPFVVAVETTRGFLWGEKRW